MYRVSLWMYGQWWMWLAVTTVLGVAWLSEPDPLQDAPVVGPVLAVTGGIGLWLLRRRGSSK